MIYITGDTHGNIDRFKPFKKIFTKYRDFVLVCGDFGFIWTGSEKERKELGKLERYSCNIMFVEGTHDNLDALEEFPLEEFCGGKVRKLAKNMLWMQRGEIYDIEGTKVFALGGGESIDADEREAGVNWWPNEMASVEELRYAASNLKKAENKVDIIITHQKPQVEVGLIEKRNQQINALTAFLGGASRAIDYKKWYFGMDHIDRTISPKMTAVFEKVVKYEP